VARFQIHVTAAIGQQKINPPRDDSLAKRRQRQRINTEPVSRQRRLQIISGRRPIPQSLVGAAKRQDADGDRLVFKVFFRPNAGHKADCERQDETNQRGR
jgi:hypothetical protein